MEAITAAIDMVDVCIQHAAYLAGRGDINEMIQEMAKGNHYIHVHTKCIFAPMYMYMHACAQPFIFMHVHVDFIH